MSQPYALFRDSRDFAIYRVAADGQSKVLTSGNAAVVDQVNLRDNHGVADADLILAADNDFLHAWLDSVPTA